jgi:hypothetical protein
MGHWDRNSQKGKAGKNDEWHSQKKKKLFPLIKLLKRAVD